MTERLPRWARREAPQEQRSLTPSASRRSSSALDHLVQGLVRRSAHGTRGVLTRLGHYRGTAERDDVPKWLELRADEGTRTLDLLHGKEDAQADTSRHRPPNRLVGSHASLFRVTRDDSNRQSNLASNLASRAFAPFARQTALRWKAALRRRFSPRCKLVRDPLNPAREVIEVERIVGLHGCERRSLAPPRSRSSPSTRQCGPRAASPYEQSPEGHGQPPPASPWRP